MRIGELARRTGLRTSAIRYYESLGILKPPARVSGRRAYGESSLNTLRLARAAQHAGFTLAETRELLATMGNDAPQAEAWESMARRKLDELDATISTLKAARRVLANAVDCACAGRADACKLVAETPQKVRAGR